MNNPQKLSLNKLSIYRIHVQGNLDENWGDYFGGLLLSTTNEADQVPISTLHTPLMDQAALIGLVNRLHGLGLSLLLVEHVSTEEDRSYVDYKA